MISFKPSLLFLSCLITVLSISNNGVNAVSCGAGSKCPSSSPCCSAEGTCGSGAMQCAGGCQAMWSNQASSCLPNPVCQNQNITITPADFNNSKMFKPILEYNGDPTQAPFTLDYGSTGAGPEGVLLELTAARQAKISTTRYFLYGEVEVTARHEALDGVVAALISMSDAKDELDWEFTTSDGTKGYTNWFSLGVVDNNNGGTSTIQPSVASWHTIGINWTPSSIQWKLDGTVVRTVKASTLGDKFPTTPARFQMSLWAGGNATNSDGVIQWSGGPVDWSSSEYVQNGYYSQEIKSFTMTCGDASSANLQTVGTNTAAPVTSYIYTGANDTNTGRPTIQLSTNPISFLKNPSKDGMAGIPGYSDGSSDSTKKTNVWDGTGDQNDSDSSSSSGDGSIFSKNAALKYGVPIGAAVVGLIVIWAIITACVRRNRGKNLKAPALGAVGSTIGGIAGGKAANSRYQALGGEDTDGLPMGATRKGAGVTAAVGPSPSARYGNVAPGQAQRQGSNQGGMRDMRQQSSSNSNGSYRPSYAAHEYDPYANYSSPQPQQQPQYRTQSPYQPYQQQQQQSRGVTFTPTPQNYRQGNGYPNYQEPSYRDRY